MNKSDIFISSLESNPGVDVVRVLGLVSSTSSRVAMGVNKQSDRLQLGVKDALKNVEQQVRAMGGNGLLGVSVVINSSEGSILASGVSTEGVLVYGTAVVIAEPPAKPKVPQKIGSSSYFEIENGLCPNCGGSDFIQMRNSEGELVKFCSAKCG